MKHLMYGFYFLSTAVAMTLPATVLAQEGNAIQLEEIVVTAQKRSQNLQNVPIAVTAISAQFLDDAGIDDVQELQAFVPGLTIFTNQTPSQTNFNIRGVGTAGNSLSLESSVGIYVDGVYRSRQSSAINDLVDVERVEVLKGPQGTLFGKNTASGAVQFLSVAPKLDEFGGFVEVNAGNLSHQNFNGAINIPLVEGKAAARISAAVTQRDGFADNLTTGEDLNNRDRVTLRGQLLIEPSKNLSIRIIADYAELDERCCSASNSFDGPGDTAALFLVAGGSLPPTGPLPNATFLLPIDVLGGDVILADQFNDNQATVNLDPFARIEEAGLSAEINWTVGGVTLTSITSYRSYEDDSFLDADFTSLNTFTAAGSATDQEAFSQEFQIAGDFGENINYIAGLYYYDQTLDNDSILQLGADANLLLTGGATTGALLGGDAGCAFFGVSGICNDAAFPAGATANNISTQEQTSIAIFAQADFNLSEKAVFTLGLRYLEEDKDLDVQFNESVFSPILGALTPLSPFVPDVDGAEVDDEAVTGTVKFSYNLSDDILTYISYGRGYKSGGTNIDRIDPALTGSPLLFDEETSDSYEIGFKGEFLNRRLRVNAAVYQTNFEDFQTNSFVGTGFVLQNAGEIEAKGFELEVFAAPYQWLTISSGVAYVDAEYDSFVNGACVRTPFGSESDAGAPGFPAVCDNSGNTVANAPEWTAFASAQVQHRLASGSVMYGQLDVNWRDDAPGGPANDPNRFDDSFTLTNFRLGYRFGDGNYDVSLWAKNVFDEDFTNGSFNSVVREGSLTSYHTEPRTYGLTLRANY